MLTQKGTPLYTYGATMGVAVLTYFIAGWIFQKYAVAIPMLIGILTSITLSSFSRNAGWGRAIILTLFVLGCSLKFQFDYVLGKSIFLGFSISFLEGLKYIYNPLTLQDWIIHLFGAAFVFFEASPFHFSRVRAKVQNVPAVIDPPSAKRYLIPYITGILATYLGCVLYLWLARQGMNGPMIPGLFASIALSCVLKRKDPLRSILLPLFVLTASLYFQFSYLFNPPVSLVYGVQNITKYLDPISILLHVLGAFFTFIEAGKVSLRYQ